MALISFRIHPTVKVSMVLTRVLTIADHLVYICVHNFNYIFMLRSLFISLGSLLNTIIIPHLYCISLYKLIHACPTIFTSNALFY